MDVSSVVTFLTMQVDSWGNGPFYCPIGNKMADYAKTAELIRACGHDTRELDQAITDANKAFERLFAAREKVVTRFKTEGVCFAVDETKRKEAEAACLQ